MKKVTSLPKLKTDSFLIDTHCHLDMEAYAEDLEQVLQNASRNGVRHIISIGIDLPSSQKAVNLARKFSIVSATIGVHPHDVDNCSSDTYSSLLKLYEQNKEHIVGYGEIGLDYFKQYSSVEQQKKQFIHQLSLAKALNLPIIIHNREAEKDMISILKKAGPFPRGGVMHCFSGNQLFAKQVLDLGLHISIPGVVTFKNANTLRDVLLEIPLTSLLLETDGPFLTPHPYRGKRNEPKFVLFTAEKVASILHLSIDELAQQTSGNAITLFNLPPTPAILNDPQ